MTSWVIIVSCVDASAQPSVALFCKELQFHGLSMPNRQMEITHIGVECPPHGARILRPDGVYSMVWLPGRDKITAIVRLPGRDRHVAQPKMLSRQSSFIRLHRESTAWRMYVCMYVCMYVQALSQPVLFCRQIQVGMQCRRRMSTQIREDETVHSDVSCTAG